MNKLPPHLEKLLRDLKENNPKKLKEFETKINQPKEEKVKCKI